MPTSYEVDADLGVVFSVLSGAVTLEDLRNNVITIHEDPQVQPHFRTLIDVSQVTSMDIEFDALSGLSQFCSSDAVRPLTGRLAIYVPERDAVYGVTRQFHALLENRDRMQVFNDRDEARAWIGLPPE